MIIVFPIVTLFLNIAAKTNDNVRVPKSKSPDELLSMSKDELYKYLRESEVSAKDTDHFEIIPVKNGTKILYYHLNEKKPYKTRVYLNRVDENELLK